MRYLVLGVCAFTVACSGATPTAPSRSLAPIVQLSSSAGDASSPETVPASRAATAAEPPFNLQVILRGDGFGLVKLRQEKDTTQNILYTDVWVRDLLPDTSYELQRAVDGPADGVCASTDWVTLGQGTTPDPILTDDKGTARAALWRLVPAIPVPLDIHFRVVQTGTSQVALQSDCYRLIVRD
jgi:hypothetical protein